MLSPGQWHKSVPRTVEDNVYFRRHVLLEARKSSHLRRGIKEACSKDILFWINTFAWQFNPRKKGGGELGPFVTWGFQDEAILEMLFCIENDHDLVIEKSREMGASWMILLVFDWLFLFKPWQKLLVISRSEKAVEDEDPDSLFWKVDFIHRYLPGWLRPNIKRRKLYFGNEDNGSTITGQASTGQAGVGGRATAMAIDEFSQIKEDYEVLHRTSDTTGCRIFNGTHLGEDTALFELTERVDIRKLKLHWTQHPDKQKGLYRWHTDNNRLDVIDTTHRFPDDYQFITDGSPSGGPFPGVRSPWYDEQCRRKGSDRAVAMDLDINPAGSVAQFFQALVIRDLINTYAAPAYWEGDIVQSKSNAWELVRSNNGPLKFWLNPTPHGKVPQSEYAVGVDVSSGTGATNSCFSILDCATGEKVGEYANPTIPAHELAPVAVAVCRLFESETNSPATLIWESVGPGQTFGQQIISLGFRQIFYRTNESKPFVHQGQTMPGWHPSDDNKRLLLEEYRAALRSRQFVNRSRLALEECLKFKYSNTGKKVYHPGEVNENDPSGAGVNHGDRTIADALAWKIAKGKGRSETAQQEAENHVGSLAWRRVLATSKEQQESAWA